MMLRGLTRVKELQNELAHARTIIDNLTSENRILKTMERRHENALTRYEGTHAELPLVIRSCGDELQSIQTRLRRSKATFRQLENRYRMQTKELLAVQKKYKHLLDLTKNKQLGEREKLSGQLEEAENTIKRHEKKIQDLIKIIELEKRNHQHQLNAETGKVRALQAELSTAKEVKNQLESMAEKIKYRSYVGRRTYVSQSLVIESGPNVPSKNALSGGDRAPRPGAGRRGKSAKPPALVHGASELSDHTEDLQTSLMKQVHEDVINVPKMLATAKKNSSDSSGGTSRLSYGISELIKKKDLSDACSDDSGGAQDADGPAANPFALSDKYGLSAVGNKRRSAADAVQCADRDPGADKSSKRDRHRRDDRNDHDHDDDDDDGGGDNDDVVSNFTFSDTD